ncbi:DUF305 domain-containing protein [Pseudonocardia sp. GCM10023141]|uniref:DUF305 domain-containing protein n=1 Tax=Pseudonocardia sp. GCM10023141 TaxID=3252653 RepID=UPI003613BCEE
MRALARSGEHAQQDDLLGGDRDLVEPADEQLDRRSPVDLPGVGVGETERNAACGQTAEQMQQLMQASGAAFDRMFLEMMTEHHRGAITMSQTEVTSGSDAEAKRWLRTSSPPSRRRSPRWACCSSICEHDEPVNVCHPSDFQRVQVVSTIRSRSFRRRTEPDNRRLIIPARRTSPRSERL